MDKKFVEIDDNGIVKEVYDEVNEKVPDDAIAITDAEFIAIHERGRSFGDFEILGGVLQLRASADDNRKERVIDNLKNPAAIKALIELLLDEINILRANAGMEPRTIAQFKTAMKGKL